MNEDANKTFDLCKREGSVSFSEEVAKGRIKVFVLLAKDYENSINLIKDSCEKGELINSVYKLYYDALHSMASAVMYADGWKSTNHKCLFAYICMKYPFLDWSFFQEIRYKRNGMSYYGVLVERKDYDKMASFFNLYFPKLLSEVEKFLESK